MKNGDPLTYQAIGGAMKVHSALGPGLIEEFYHQAMSQELTAAGITFESKPRRDFIYQDQVADTFEADFLVENQLIVELKALSGEFAQEHFKQVLCYLKFWKQKTGLLLDFGKASLFHKRVTYTSRQSNLFVHSQGTDKFCALENRTIDGIQKCLREIGLGYRKTTWQKLIQIALQREGLHTTSKPRIKIAGLGQTNLDCIVVEGDLLLSVGALGKGVSAIDRSRLQTCLRWLQLNRGLCFHFGSAKAEVMTIEPPKNKSAAFLNLREIKS